MRSTTRRRVGWCRSGSAAAALTTSRWRSPTRALGSQQKTSSTFSSASIGPTALAREIPAASASACRSRGSWSRRWAAVSPSPLNQDSAARSPSAFADRSLTKKLARILVVEDEVALADLLRSHLEKEGHVVEHAFEGKHALAAADRARPDLVILDWMLPGVDGLTVCQELRRKHLMPILMLTARGEGTALVRPSCPRPGRPSRDAGRVLAGPQQPRDGTAGAPAAPPGTHVLARLLAGEAVGPGFRRSRQGCRHADGAPAPKAGRAGRVHRVRK